MASPHVTIVVLNWNEQAVLRECLQSIYDLTYPCYRVVVVDNGSTDDSPSVVRHEFPNAHLIKNRRNLGYAEGLNTGIRYAMATGAEYIFVLNNDMKLDQNALKELVDSIENDSSIGIAAPLIYEMDSPTIIDSGGAIINWNRGNAYHVRETRCDDNKYTPEIDYSGVFVARSELFQQIGLFDSTFFTYWEDTDFCVRAKKAGYRVVCVHSAKVWHRIGHTIKKITGFREYYATRNRLWFMQKHATKRANCLFFPYFFIGVFWHSTFQLLQRGDKAAYSCFIKGVYDGLVANKQRRFLDM